MAHYNRSQMAAAIRAVGVAPGDVAFSHANVGYFGVPEEGRGAQAVVSVILGAFFDVLGPNGTLVVPTFSYSFNKGESYEPASTPSSMGLFAEAVRCRPDAVRSEDPNFSVAAIGGGARELVENVSEETFGADGFFDRFLRAGGVVCNLNFDAGSTFIHYVENRLRVPYRYAKSFHGHVRVGAALHFRRVIQLVRDLSSPLTISAFEPFDCLARERGLARVAKVGRGSVLGIRAADTLALIAETLPERPWLLTAADTAATKPDLAPRLGTDPFAVPQLDAKAAGLPQDVARALDALPRVGATPGVEAALAGLARILPLEIRHVPTGTWIGAELVPERWVLTRARLADEGGRTLAEDGGRGRLVPAYSRAFHGVVDRETLLAHLVDGPNASLLGRNTWGLSLRREQVASLQPGGYQVDIDVDQCFGALALAGLDLPGDGPAVTIALDLGGDPRDVGVATAWFVTLAKARHRSRAWKLRVYPRPFAAAVFLDDTGEIRREFSASPARHDIDWTSASEVESALLDLVAQRAVERAQ